MYFAGNNEVMYKVKLSGSEKQRLIAIVIANPMTRSHQEAQYSSVQLAANKHREEFIIQIVWINNAI